MVDDICEVRPKGRLDSASGPAFKKDLLGRIESGRLRMLPNFGELQYISSAGCADRPPCREEDEIGRGQNGALFA